ncbi:zinc-binding dehydrogenase [Actinocrispum sp. NPDC049592]|uniref:zinc-binding dehydrogenase n=1 Tax=Actinocrispum sp. NPDC049592 TaxID=3154835 RepID=UPI00344AF332
MRVVLVTEFGGPEVLKVATAAEPVPSDGQVLVAVERAAVLYGETIVRRGEHPFPLPYVPGMEIGGRVVAAPGHELDGRLVVGTTTGLSGGYAEFALAEDVHLVPDGMSLDHAVALFGAGGLAVGLLAAMDVGPDDTVLITAAAGRMGSLLVQLAKAAGARVIGAVGTQEKLDAVRAFGADVAVSYSDPDWAAPVEATVVLDAIGGDVGPQALAAVATGVGRIGFYGYASGRWPDLDIGDIARRGLTVVGSLGKVLAKPAAERRADVQRALTAGLTPRIHAVHPLERAADAHTDLEQRRNVGAVLLDVTPPRGRP